MLNFPRLLGVALLALPRLTAGGGATATPQPTFVVDGRVAEPLTLTMQDLRDFPVQSQEVHFISDSGQEVHRYQGALLFNVLAAAKPQFDSAVDKLRHAVLVGATDGYQTVVSWGEIDPLYANTQVLLACEADGSAMERPQLVVPSDEHWDRYVYDIGSVSLLRVGA